MHTSQRLSELEARARDAERDRAEALAETDRIRREAASRERAFLAEIQATENRLNSILQSISDGFILLDRDWRALQEGSGR